MSQSDGVHDVRFPDMVVGIGNAGKQVVYEFMDPDSKKSRWIHEKAMSPDRRDDIDAYVIDTDEEERRPDEKRVGNINQRIRSLATDDLGRNSTTVDDEPLEYIHQLDGLSQDFRSTDSSPLTQSPNLAKLSGFRTWWLTNSEDMLVDDYTEGVLRRRALSKALFYASNSSPGQNPLNAVLNPSVSDVYMVVGLGGGTGSGMFFDIAEEIEDNVENVYLFGVIPDTGETTVRLANAHAALSELEYRSRVENLPFKNVVLLPFGGLENFKDEREQEEFDRGVVNAIMAHKNFDSNNERYFKPGTGADDVPPYAPFTVAVPRTLQYSTGDARETKAQVDSFIDDRIDALEAEHDLYEALEDYIAAEFEGEESAGALDRAKGGQSVEADAFSLTDQQAGTLRRRFDDLLDLLDEQIFDTLEYEPAAEWTDILDDRIEQAERGKNSPTKQDEAVVTEAPRATENRDSPGEVAPQDESHQKLEAYVQTELRAIRRRANLLRTVSLVGDDDLRQGIESALNDDQTTVPQGIIDEEGRLAGIKDGLTEDVSTAGKIKQKLERQTLDEQKEAWKNAVRADLEQLIDIEGEDELTTLLSDLDEAIHDAVGTIDGATRSRQLGSDVSDVFEFDSFGTLNEKLREADQDDIDTNSITRSIDAIRQAKLTKIEAQEGDGGILQSISNALFGGDESDAEARFDGFIGQVDDDLFDFEDEYGEPFYCAYQHDFKTRTDDLDEATQECIDDMVSEFEKRLRDPPVDRDSFLDEAGNEWTGEFDGWDGRLVWIDGVPQTLQWPGDTDGYVDTLRSELQTLVRDRENPDPDDLLDELTAAEESATDLGSGSGGCVHEGFYASIVAPVKRLISDLDDETDRVDATLAKYAELKSIIEDEGGSFARTETPDKPDLDFESPDEQRQYIDTVEPDDSPRLLGSDSLVDAKLHDDHEGVIGSKFVDFADQVANLDGRLPLVDGSPEVDPGVQKDGSDTDTRYHHMIQPVFMGQAFGTDKTAQTYGEAEVQQNLRATISADDGEDGYLLNTCPYGHPWEMSLVTFVGGIFLDNLRPAARSGYHSNYHALSEEGLETTMARHAHGLDGNDRSMLDDEDKGAYVRRQSLIDLEDPDERTAFVDMTHEKRLEFIADEHADIQDFESTFDPDA
jgi:hypothetical protein